MINNIAHRGYSKYYPENTMLAFEKAIEANCSAIELDIQMSGDGNLVIFHDDELKRTTTGEGPINAFSYGELKNLDAGKLFPGTYSGVRIPLLEEYFHFIRDKNIISIIELKKKISPDAKMEEKAIEMIRSYKLTDKVILSSFSQKSVLRSGILAPEIKTALITDYWLHKAGHISKSLGATYIHPRHPLLLPFILNEMKREGMLIQPWTVDDRRRMKRLIGSGVHGIITNDPKLLHEVINESENNKS